MRKLARLLLITCIVLGSVFRSAAAADEDPTAGWIQLFDGSSRFGWVASGGNWQTAASTLVSDRTSASRIATDLPFADFTLRFEARVNGGPASVVVRLDPNSKPAQPGVQFGLSDGSIEGQHGAVPLPPDTQGWRRFEIKADGDQLTLTVNGVQIATQSDARSRIGAIQFEAPKGSRLEVRSVWLKPLELTNLYNGSNLDGWRAIEPKAPEKKSGGLHLPIPGLSSKPKPLKAAHWAGDGSIHGSGGEGQLETTQAYQDFVLQLSTRVAGDPHDHKTAAAELLFRGTAGQFGSGYALDAEAAAAQKAVPPGNLLSPEKTRLGAAAPHGANHAVTMIARARRFAMWLDGHEVMDSYDSRPEGTYHAAAGPIALLIADPKTSLSVSNAAASALAQGPQPPPPPTPIPAPGTAPQPTAAKTPAMPTINLPPMPGQSPEDKARADQVRALTIQALEAQSPADAVRINKQILVLDPGDMPAQQRLDKAQATLDAQNAVQQHILDLHLASASKLEQNATRRDALMAQAEDALLHGRTNQARDRLNDAQRMGARGPEVDHLQSIIHSRIRNRIILWSSLATAGVVALIAGIMAGRRRRRQVLVGYLIALDGAEKGRRYLLNQEVTHVGGVAMDTGKKNEVIVRDPDRLVSRFHLEVHKRKNLYYVIDLDSSNGTCLNGRKLPAGTPTRLRDGDRVELAKAATLQLQLQKS